MDDMTANPATQLPVRALVTGPRDSASTCPLLGYRAAFAASRSLLTRAGRERYGRSGFAPKLGQREDSTVSDEMISVRYMVDDVAQSIDFYTDAFDFTLGHDASPAFAEVSRGNLRLLLAGPSSSAGRPMPDGRKPEPGGWNRIHFIVKDLAIEVERLRAAGVSFRNDIISGPGGKQILADDPSGNPIELFQPAR